MISRKAPFSGMHIHTILYLTGTGKTPSEYDIEDGFQGKYTNLYRKSWNIVPDTRPDLALIIHKLKQMETEIS